MPGLIVDVRRIGRRSRVGGKARQLARLAAAGLAVPPAWVVPTASLQASGPDARRLSAALAEVLDPSHEYAVRSSADVEDLETRSYAGRFVTLLGVAAESVTEAVYEVASATADDPVSSYTTALGEGDVTVEMSVIVQQMVRPQVAGVVFSRNPVSGIKETVIEAAPGTAEDLVAGRVHPQRWVRKHGEWVHSPEQPLLPAEIASEIADGAERIERLFGWPIDAEWAWDGTVWWLQARPVTVGTQAAVYSSKMARDMLPGIIVPLVWSINGPLKSEVFVRFLEDVFGPLDVEPSDLATLFHYRMYINIGALSRLFAEFGLPEESLEMLAGMEKGAGMPGMPRPTPRALKRLPRLVYSIWSFSRFDRRLRKALPGLWTRSAAFADEADPWTLGADELLERMERLYETVQDVAYHHLVTLMLMQMYTMRLRSRLVRKRVIEKGSPLHLAPSEPSPHDVGAALTSLAVLAARQPEAVRSMLRDGDFEGLRECNEGSEFVEALDRFLTAFGHFSDSGVNFSSTPWREQPGCVLKMIEAQAAISGRAERESGNGGALSRPEQFGRAGRRAAAFHVYREETSSLYAHIYGQYRPHVLALGHHLVERGALKERNDILYLTLEEVRRVVAGSLAPGEARLIVDQRTREVELASEGEPPEVVVGDVAELIQIPGRRVFRGIPSSRGRHTGRVVICRGMVDLDRIADGDVVVVPFSDASWTPLFSRAGAIVAESGGLLSHSAILSRELGVPSIVSVRGALAMADGSLVSVDGFEGTVTVLDTA